MSQCDFVQSHHLKLELQTLATSERKHAELEQSPQIYLNRREFTRSSFLIE